MLATTLKLATKNTALIDSLRRKLAAILQTSYTGSAKITTQDTKSGIPSAQATQSSMSWLQCPSTDGSQVRATGWQVKTLGKMTDSQKAMSKALMMLHEVRMKEVGKMRAYRARMLSLVRVREVGMMSLKTKTNWQIDISMVC